MKMYESNNTGCDMHTPEHQTMLILVSQSYMNHRADESNPTEKESLALDKILAKIRKENKSAFHTKETLKTRRFFHRPSSLIEYESFACVEIDEKEEDVDN